MKKKHFILALMCIFAVVFCFACGETQSNGNPSSVEGSTGTIVTMNKHELELFVGDSETLRVDVSDFSEVTWTSSDPTIASVDNGVVSALHVGTAAITATANGVSDTCNVTVKQPENTDPILMELLINGYAISDGDTVNVTSNGQVSYLASLMQSGLALGANFTATSSVESVATIEGSSIKALSAGETLITISTEYEGTTYSVEFTLNVSTSCTVTLNYTSISLSTITGGVYPITETLTATVILNGQEVENPTIIWQSGDENVVAVENGVLTSVGAGDTTVTAFYEVGDETVSAYVTVHVEATAVKGGQVFADKYDASAAGGNYAIDVGAIEGTISSVTLSSGAKVAEIETFSYAEDVLTVAVVDVDDALSAAQMPNTGYFTLSVATSKCAYTYDTTIANKVITTWNELRNWAYYVRPDDWANNKANTYNGLVVLGADIDCQGNWFDYLELMTGEKSFIIQTDTDGTTYKEENKSSATGDNVTTNAYDSRFYGVFDGLGHTVSNYKIHWFNASYGLFGEYMHGTVKNLKITGAEDYNNFAGLISYAFLGTAENVYIEGGIAANVTAQASLFAGRLMGTPTLTNVVCKLTSFEPTGSVQANCGIVNGLADASVNASKFTNVYGIGSSSVNGAIQDPFGCNYADEAAFKQSVADGTISLAWAEESPYWKVVDNMPVFVGAAE